MAVNLGKGQVRSFFEDGKQTEINMEPALEAGHHFAWQVPPSSRTYISKSENEDKD